jgi:hypothetical protein
VNIAKIIWAVVATATAFGVNLHMRPQFEAAYERSEPHEVHGTLVVSGQGLEIPTLAAHVVVEDMVHVGKVYGVRELSVRSQSPVGAAPSFELFAALPDSVGAVAGRRLPPSALLQLELVVQETGRLGARESFVQRDAAGAGRVVTGSWQFTSMREVSDTGQPEIRGEARVELQVERDGKVELLTGRWSGRVLWE